MVSPLLFKMLPAISTEFPFISIAFDYQVDFFPEGGNLIGGCTQKIGIKAIDIN